MSLINNLNLILLIVLLFVYFYELEIDLDNCNNNYKNAESIIFKIKNQKDLNFLQKYYINYSDYILLFIKIKKKVKEKKLIKKLVKKIIEKIFVNYKKKLFMTGFVLICFYWFIAYIELMNYIFRGLINFNFILIIINPTIYRYIIFVLNVIIIFHILYSLMNIIYDYISNKFLQKMVCYIIGYFLIFYTILYFIFEI